MAEDPLRDVVDRLYEQEREERNERRAIESRAGTTFGAALVGIGLVVNAATTESVDLGSWKGIVFVGFLASLVGLIVLTAMMAFHTGRPRDLRRNPRQTALRLEPGPLTQEYIAWQRCKVERLGRNNAQRLHLVRIATLLVGLGIYLAAVGVGVSVL
jgi:uncharacterized membrane protein YdcZ (DUF606 family)